MKKVIIGIAALVCLVTIIVTCTRVKSDRNQEPLTLVMAEVNPENSVCGQMDAAFKNKVEELSGGKIKIDVRYSGVLGDEKEVINLMKNPESSIQLCRFSANLSGYGEPKSALISVPFTFKNSEHFWKFAKSDIAKELLEEPYKKGLGLRGLCYAEEGFRSFLSIEPVNSYKDLEGKKMRVSGKTLTDLALALKAQPVTVPFTDLYSSLQTGATEVAEQPLANCLSNSFFEVAPYIILDRHMLGAVQILITSEQWDKLSPEYQEIIQEAAEFASDFCKIIAEEEEVSAAIKLVNEGVTIKNVENNSEWQKACEKMILENTKDYSELYEKIQNLAN